MDFVSGLSPELLQAKLLALGDVEVISVYAVGGTHFAWFKIKKISTHKKVSKE